MSDRAPFRDPQVVDAMVRRLDHRVVLVVTAAAILGLGAVAFYVGVPLVWGERVPFVVCAIPPAIFATIPTVGALVNAREVRIARRLLVEGECMQPQEWAWTVFAFAAPGDSRDPRRWSVPAQGTGGHDIELDLLETYRDWNPRQTRTVSVWLADRRRLTIPDIPAHVSVGDLRSAPVLRLDTGRAPVFGIAVPGMGLFPARD